MLTFLTGFFASIAHVVTGPDHLAAVTPLAIDSRKKSWAIGLSWGLGHTIGMLLIGSVFIYFKGILPVAEISKHSETVIGCMLIIIGLWALLRVYRHHSHKNRPHGHFHEKPFFFAHIHKHSHNIIPVEDFHHHEHGHGHPHHHNEKHDPRHSHNPGHDHHHSSDLKIRHKVFTAFSIGIIHGFAGFSHLFALLPSLALPSVMASVIYITAFASGTIVTMILFAFLLGLVAFQSLLKDKQVFLKWFTFCGALLAIGIGILWLVNPV
ncbi:MAG: hypothetical protein WCO63_12630 [Bacteroidota bacterium]